MSGCQTLSLTELKALALEETASAVVIADRNGNAQWHNDAFTRLTGYRLEEVVGRNLRFLQSGRHDRRFYACLWQTISSGRPWRGQLVNRRKDGQLYVEEQTITPVRGDDGEITHFIAIKYDITDRKTHEKQLAYLATHDALTNLYNRRALEDALESAIACSRRGGRYVLAYLDIDNLKLVNDSLGHAAGDEALKALAHRLQQSVPPGSLLARVAGDEFVVLLRNSDLEQALKRAERFRQRMSDEPLFVNGGPIYLTVSIGLVPVCPQSNVQELLSRADASMYEAKQRGGNQIEVVDTHAPYVDLIDTGFNSAQRIRRLLEHDQLFFHYQPIFDLKTRRITAYEALLRARDDNNQVVSAGKLLRAAERGGFMTEVDRWVVSQALQVLEQRPHVNLSINLSAHAMNDVSLIKWMVERLVDFRSGSSRLGIEITETSVIHDLTLANRCLRKLRPLVGWIFLDDFGAGYNSFGYLRQLSIGGLKIDGSLIRDVLHNLQHQAIVRAIQVLAEGFNIPSVAEHVEDEETARFLADIGVEYGQGYWLGKPTYALPA